jgi:hypothetical protein
MGTIRSSHMRDMNPWKWVFQEHSQLKEDNYNRDEWLWLTCQQIHVKQKMNETWSVPVSCLAFPWKLLLVGKNKQESFSIASGPKLHVIQFSVPGGSEAHSLLCIKITTITIWCSPTSHDCQQSNLQGPGNMPIICRLLWWSWFIMRGWMCCLQWMQRLRCQWWKI